MKTLKIKATIQVGDTKVEVSGEFARLGMTKDMQHKELSRLRFSCLRVPLRPAYQTNEAITQPSPS